MVPGRVRGFVAAPLAGISIPGIAHARTNETGRGNCPGPFYFDL